MTKRIVNNLEKIISNIGSRPVGAKTNNELIEWLQEQARHLGYESILLPFECKVWETEKSSLTIHGETYTIFPSPFSRSFHGNAELCNVACLDELKNKDYQKKILILCGDLTKEPLMPTDFPFYYPKEHKVIVDHLQASEPAAILALTGKHPMCGLDPFPLFEDGNFSIPTAFLSNAHAEKILKGDDGYIEIHSRSVKAESQQIIMRKNSDNQEKIIVCAHMDTKYDTPGALDNGSGLAVMLEMMHMLKDKDLSDTIDFVPFNSEEYYGVNGQLLYLEQLSEPVKCVINIDSPGHKDSKTALSFYNFDNNSPEQLLDNSDDMITIGEEWYAGDHSMFAFKGTRCIAVTSSNLFETVLELTHTENDTLENVDAELIKKTADFLSNLIIKDRISTP